MVLGFKFYKKLYKFNARKQRSNRGLYRKIDTDDEGKFHTNAGISGSDQLGKPGRGIGNFEPKGILGKGSSSVLQTRKTLVLCKTSNSSTYLQLNMYGFHKVCRNKNSINFRNKFFFEGNEPNFHLIKRRKKDGEEE